jgi:hypothetical protein
VGVLAALVALLVAPAVAQPADQPRDGPPDPPLLSIDTSIGARDVTSVEVQLRVPLTGASKDAIERLRSTPAAYSERYERKLKQAFLAGGFLSQEQASAVITSVEDLPELRIANGNATLTATAPYAVLWQMRGDDDRVLELAPIEVRRGTRLVVLARAPDRELESASPLPVEDDASGTLRWEFADRIDEPARIQLSEPESAPSRRAYLKAAASFLALGLPFALLLLVAAFDRRAREPRLGGAPVRLALAGLTVSVACAAYYFLQDLRLSPDGGRSPGAVGASGVFIDALVPALGVIAYAVLPRGARRVRLVVLLAVAVAFAAVVAANVSSSGSGALKQDYEDTNIVAGCVLAALLVGAAFAASVRWVAEAMPEAAGAWRKALSQPVRIGLLVALVGGVMAQILLANHGVDLGFARLGFDREGFGWVALLRNFLESFSIQLAGLVRNTALMIFGLALAVWLWRRVGDRELELNSWRSGFAFSLLVAMLVPGLNGQIEGFAAPLAFLFAMVGFTLAIHRLAPTPLARLARDGAVKQAAPDLLRKASELVVTDRRRQALTDDLLANDIEQQDHNEQLQKLEARRAELLAGSAALSSIDDLDERERATLTLGLGGEEGARERLRGILRNGWWVVLVPVAYSAFAVLDLRAEGAVSAHQPFGLSFLVVSLLDQMLMWPILIWCFVVVAPIVPGRRGAWKGLAAGLFCALPPALARPLIDDPLGPSQWLFLAAELTLVLTVVGVLMDYRAVKRIGGDLRQLGDLYSITTVRVAVTYLASSALLLFSVGQGLATGEGASALEQLITNASSLIPGGR